ncbi:MAG: hypothetical protein ACYC36_13225 [Bellilinea sp.]
MTDKKSNLKPFVKGDPRINRKGRPKSFDAVRELAQSISHEVAKSGGQPVVTDGHVVTVAEMILRQWASSKNPQLQKAFIELAFGKVPDTLNVKTDIIDVVLKGNDKSQD